MDELSGSQFCDERPRLHPGSDGEDIRFCQPHSKRGSHVRFTQRMGVKVGGREPGEAARGWLGIWTSSLLHHVRIYLRRHTLAHWPLNLIRKVLIKHLCTQGSSFQM